MHLDTLNDQELVRLFVNKGSQTALETLINRYKKQVYSYIFFHLKSEEQANDVFQDTFLKVIKSLKTGKYTDENKLLAWIIRIAHNLIIDHYRLTKKMAIVSNNKPDYDMFDLMRTKEQSVEKDIISNQIYKEIKHLVYNLPDEQREVVILRHYVGMSFKEIAAYSGVSINTALGRMRYALINLRKQIQEKQLDLLLN